LVRDGIEFYNVAELNSDDGHAGLRLQRVPESIRRALNDRAQERMLAATGSELRFVSSSEKVVVTLSRPEGSAELIPFFGPFQVNHQRHSIRSEPTPIEITRPQRLTAIETEVRAGLSFSPDVWRLTLRGNGVYFHGIEGEDLRPPTKGEVPSLCYLAYGTSITHGSAASAGHLTYVAQTAWRLGADLINLGVGGFAYCEPELADYIADREDWDVATLSLSVNMIGAGFSDAEFRDRTSYFVNTVAGANPKRPFACITIYPHFRDFAAEDPAWVDHSERFREIYREVVQACPHPKVVLIEGPDLLADIGGLTTDLIHPGDLGMIQMGQELAKRLEKLLESVT